MPVIKSKVGSDELRSLFRHSDDLATNGGGEHITDAVIGVIEPVTT
jgi:hypothetical protein